MDHRYAFPRIHWFAELGKMPGVCVKYSIQSSKGCVRLRDAIKVVSRLPLLGEYKQTCRHNSIWDQLCISTSVVAVAQDADTAAAVC